MKKYATFAFVYAVLAMAAGVFYRELTKIIGFTGKTTLSVMHTHYFMLGMFFFLLMLVLEKSFAFSGQKSMRFFLPLYNIGLNITGGMLFLRGIMQATQTQLSTGLTAAISGIAGLGHIILGAAIIIMLWGLRKSIAPKNTVHA